jgi:hypothetical protein
MTVTVILVHKDSYYIRQCSHHTSLLPDHTWLVSDSYPAYCRDSQQLNRWSAKESNSDELKKNSEKFLGTGEYYRGG